MKMLTGLFPKSLFGRLVIVLIIGLILAQLITSYILLRDRGQVLSEVIQGNLIDRAADITHLIDSLDVNERNRLLPYMSSKELRIRRTKSREDIPELTVESELAAKLLATQLKKRLSYDANIIIAVMGSIMGTDMPVTHREPMMHSRKRIRRHSEIGGVHTMAQFFHIQVRLGDGSWLHFEKGVVEDVYNWPLRLLIALGILLISVMVVSLFAVNTIVKPLKKLRMAAEGLGKDITRPPLQVSGATEIRETANAFNTMQTRLKRYIEERSRFLAAISHDLKTPLTRIRLRTDLMEDSEVRDKIQADLSDMEVMISGTLDYMRGSEHEEARQPIDLMAMLDSICEDHVERGVAISMSGEIGEPYFGKPLSFKRCIVNLVDNAVRYGEVVEITLSDSPETVVISICDSGSGIPEDMLEKVFDPFVRLEDSRSRETGGSGLGLGISRNIARAHGGDLVLHNRQDGGLCAIMKLPR